MSVWADASARIVAAMDAAARRDADAEWTVDGGSGSPIKVEIQREPADNGFTRTTMQAEIAYIASSDLPAGAAKGDTIDVDGTVYTVESMLDDGAGLVECELNRA